MKLTKRGVEFKGSNTKQRKKLMHDLLLDLKIFRHLLDKIESSPEKQLTEEMCIRDRYWPWPFLSLSSTVSSGSAFPPTRRNATSL